MARIEFKNDVTRAFEEAEGSDGRMNVSSRSDGRAYYNSRDLGQCYALTFQHTAAIAAEYSFWLQNTSVDKTLVVSSIGVNAIDTARVKLWFTTGVGADGGLIVPRNLNGSSPNDAACVARETAAATPISHLAVSGIHIDQVAMSAYGHEELRLSDRVRLGQNDAVALECEQITSAVDIFGVVFFYFE